MTELGPSSAAMKFAAGFFRNDRPDIRLDKDEKSDANVALCLSIVDAGLTANHGIRT
jgi:hypothetical protein